MITVNSIYIIFFALWYADNSLLLHRIDKEVCGMEG